MPLFDTEFQDDHLLRDAFEEVFRDVDNSQDLQGKLLEKLILYAGFELEKCAETEVDPFPDPFVAAALINDQGDLIAAHRKTKHDQPHAEVITLCRSLGTNGEGARVLDSIMKGYENRVWLKDEASRVQFIDLFRTAGELVRKRHDKLILLSTLEPCRAFESQPGCARLIAAFHPTKVWYGCDDTNPKGQGRPVLKERTIEVVPNLRPQLNIRINRLFYASVHYLQRLLSFDTEGRQPQYVLAQLRNPLCKLSGVDNRQPENRLKLHFEDLNDTVYSARLGAGTLGSVPDAKEVNEWKVDWSRALFIKDLDVSFVAQYYREHSLATGVVPGWVVIFGQLPEIGRDSAVLQHLKDAGVRVYSDVFQKVTERHIALTAIRRSLLVRSPYQHIVAKTQEGKYISGGGAPDTIQQELEKYSDCRKIILFFAGESYGGVAKVIDILAKFTCTAELVCLTNQDGAAHYKNEIQGLIRNRNLIHRARCEIEIEFTKEQASAKELRNAVVSGRMDPIRIGKESLSRLLESDSWRGRRSAGLLLSAACLRDSLLYNHLILRQLPQSFDKLEWRKLCSLLNSIAKLGRQAGDDRNGIVDTITQLGSALHSEFVSSEMSDSSVLVDVVWRYVAAVYAVAASDEEVKGLIGDLRGCVASSSFLLKEMLFYSFRANLTTFALEVLEGSLKTLESEPAKGVMVRATRLVWSQPEDSATSVQQQVSCLSRRAAQFSETCDNEKERCKRVMSQGLAGVFANDNLVSGPQELCSYLFVRTAPSHGVPRGLVSTLQMELKREFLPRLRGSEVAVDWRGDKAGLARLVLSEVEPQRVGSYLEAMARDEDDTIQWAALVLALDVNLRQQRLGNSPGKAGCLRLRKETAEIVAIALEQPRLYWLEREFLELYVEEHFGRDEPVPLWARLQISDVPDAAALVFSAGDVHPEVEAARKNARKRFRRILLVLPPLTRKDRFAAHETSTPPLGLASIGTHLRSRGHDVQLLDCHRYPEHLDRLLKVAKQFDFVGFNVVTSTFESTREIVAELKRYGDLEAKIVIGGPGATLHPNAFKDDRTFQWDYLVLGDGELTMQAIVEHPEACDDHPNIVCPQPRDNGGFRAGYLENSDWDSMAWIDRRLFCDPNGNCYEPSGTRNGNFQEAHIVMSRGCNWGCTFCTEAVVRGGNRELRRSAADVVQEVCWLVKERGIQRIQFVDDNLLPQLAVEEDSEKATEWTEKFLDGLSQLKRDFQEEFGWRAIFRLEDFLKYENHFGGWPKRLADSGCVLLAFGVESGDAARRHALKGGRRITNDEIKEVLQRLNGAGIFSKGYFIIGGSKENDQTAQKTIEFARDAGFDLAYFALYKQFRALVNESRELARRGKELGTKHKDKYMKFNLLSDNLGDVIKNCKVENARQLFGRDYSKQRLEEAKHAIRTLEKDHFSFKGLFKYNDFHADMENYAEHREVWATGDEMVEDFLRAVRRAYLEFYARREFVDCYKRLVKKGY